MTKLLLQKGYSPIVVDNLSTGHEYLVRDAELEVCDLSDADHLSKIFKKHEIACVMHFAGSSIVSESVSSPDKYFQNNLSNGINLLNTIIKHDVKNIIFSSTAAIFGMPQYTPIDENHPKIPINPYGQSKLLFENVLECYCHYYNLNSISFRYFNACGASPDGDIGEHHEVETHLIPNILKAALLGHTFKIFGKEHETFDGTCVRDYIHVLDICNAHLIGMEHLFLGDLNGPNYFNLGNNKGYSVMQVLNEAKDQLSNENIDIDYEIEAKRMGDPPTLICDNRLSLTTLNWVPLYSDIRIIIKHSLEWEKNLISKKSC